MTAIKKIYKGSRDIIRKKNPDRTRAGLLKCEELVNAIFQTTDMGIALFDQQGRYIKTNKGYNELLGYEDGELDGRSFTFTAPPGYKKDSRKNWKGYFWAGIQPANGWLSGRTGSYYRCSGPQKLSGVRMGRSSCS